MDSPERWRKRKRTIRARANLRRKDLPIPMLSTICCILVMLAVCLRTALRAEIFASESNNGGGTLPLATLLLNQHEIDVQAAEYADPDRCLSPKPSEMLGPFTCVADITFVVRALATVMQYQSFLLVTVGNESPWDIATPSHDFEQEFGLRMKERVGADSNLPTSDAGLVLVEVNEDKSHKFWSHILLKCHQATEENGLVVVHSRQGYGWGNVCVGDNCEMEQLRRGDKWVQGSTGLKVAVQNLMCTDKSLSIAVGDLDGGVVLIRRASKHEVRIGVDCINFETEGKGVAWSPRSLQFEELFQWAVGDMGFSKNVYLKFGGVEAVRENARRRSRRSACFHPKQPVKGDKAEQSGRRSIGRFGSKRHDNKKGDAAPEDEVQTCLEEHLREYQNDVRAAFALEMSVKAGVIGRGARRRCSRLRDTALAKSGQSGALLWRKLHALAASTVAANS